MTIISPLLRSMYNDSDNFFDTWNTLGLIGVIAVGAVSIHYGGFTPQSVLVAVTAFYAFISFNQMREARWNRRPESILAVRPYFRPDEDSDTVDFGLGNFGESPALNLRLKGILREGGEKVDSFTVSGEDRHLHLKEGGFITLVPEVSELKTCRDLADGDDPIYENFEQKSIELYYTFESNAGIQYPRGWTRPQEMEMADVVDQSESPRTVELGEIREKYALQEMEPLPVV